MLTVFYVCKSGQDFEKNEITKFHLFAKSHSFSSQTDEILQKMKLCNLILQTKYHHICIGINTNTTGIMHFHSFTKFKPFGQNFAQGVRILCYLLKERECVGIEREK